MKALAVLLALSFCLLVTGGPSVRAQVPAVSEYDLIGYGEPAMNNRVARLAERLQRGEVELVFSGTRGYLDSLLTALEIDTASQVLVFSKTSLQYPLIDGRRPRAIYFNDDTYIGFVQNSRIIEITTMDTRLGAVFYTFNNAERQAKVIPESQRCLVCHDSTGATGGGIPQILARSAVYGSNDTNLLDLSGNGNTTDKTPFAERWGGWYVSGLHGRQRHLGNLRVQGPEDLARLDDLRRGNLPTLAGQGLFDTSPYPTPTSDIVALMVLEHQLLIQNQLTYVKFKAPAVLQRVQMADGVSATQWNDIPARGQRALSRMLDNLLRMLLQTEAIGLTDRVEGLPTFQQSFLARGPFDAEGRSLRALDLEKRLFRYPLSYQIYSADFDTLPAFALDYLYQQLAAVLEGRHADPAFARLDTTARAELLAILRATKPAIVPYLAAAGGGP